MSRTTEDRPGSTLARPGRRRTSTVRAGSPPPGGRVGGKALRGRSVLLTAFSIVLASCSENPVRGGLDDALLSSDAVKFWESNATAYWNVVSRDFVTANRSPAPFAIRAYAIVSVAQYHAAIAAEKGKVADNHPSVPAAIAGASVTTLSYLYPAQASALEQLLEDFLTKRRWPGSEHQDLTSGLAVGRAAGELIVERARTDNFFAPGSAVAPVGPCSWSSAAPAVGALWGQAKTFLITSGSQFRPPPPPACDSQEFAASLSEVREISDTRTPEQDANARFWDFPAGTYTPPGYWNEEAVRLTVKHRRNARETAHLFALLNMVSYDAIVASHEAKYFYWLLRPTMADPAITVSIPVPNANPRAVEVAPDGAWWVVLGGPNALARRSPAGEMRYVRISGEPVFGAGGRFAGYRGVGRDVTPQVRAEESLRESEARFRSLTALSSDWFWEQDAEYRFTRLEGRNVAGGDPALRERLLGRRRWESDLEVDGGWDAHRAALEPQAPGRAK